MLPAPSGIERGPNIAPVGISFRQHLYFVMRRAHDRRQYFAAQSAVMADRHAGVSKKLIPIKATLRRRITLLRGVCSGVPHG
jgi:hypothetical protein